MAETSPTGQRGRVRAEPSRKRCRRRARDDGHHLTHAEPRHSDHFTVRAGGVEAVDAAWRYADSPLEELCNRVRFQWAAMDAWFDEEDEEVFVHTRSPTTRIQILPSSRHVTVSVGEIAIADTPPIPCSSMSPACRAAPTSPRSTCAWISSWRRRRRRRARDTPADLTIDGIPQPRPAR